MYVDLKLAKQHLRVEEDFTDDDDLIESKIEEAEALLEKDLCKDLKSFEREDGTLPPPLRQCILLALGSWYANAENDAPVRMYQISLSYDYIIGLYRDPQL